MEVDAYASQSRRTYSRRPGCGAATASSQAAGWQVCGVGDYPSSASQVCCFSGGLSWPASMCAALHRSFPSAGRHCPGPQPCPPVQNLVPTAVEAIGGFLIGVFAGILVAALFVHCKPLQKIFFPAGRGVELHPGGGQSPNSWFDVGSGLAPKVTIAAFVCFFPTR